MRKGDTHIDIPTLMHYFIETIFKGEKHERLYSLRILTNEDAEKWNAYCAIGTVEECRSAVEKQKNDKVLKNQCSLDPVKDKLETLRDAERNLISDNDENCAKDYGTIFSKGRTQGRFEAFNEAIKLIDNEGILVRKGMSQSNATVSTNTKVNVFVTDPKNDPL